MEYIVKFPKSHGDVIPLSYVVNCLAVAKTTAYGSAPFHQQKYDLFSREYTALFLSEESEKHLQICDKLGTPATAEKLIETAKKSGALSETKRYIVEPDWEQLNRENPPIIEGIGAWNFTGIDLGQTETDWGQTYLSCLYVKHHHLNEWAKVRGG